MIHDSSRLPLWLPVLVGAGIALYFAQTSPMPLWPALLGLAVSAALGVRLWHLAVPRLFFFALCAMLLGISASSIRLSLVDAPVLKEPIFFKTIEGTVKDIQRKEKKVKLVLEKPAIETLDAAATPVKVTVSLKKLEVPLAIGDRIIIDATLFPPPTPTMPGAYDFARMFYFDQIGAVGFSVRQPEVTAHVATSNITAKRLAIADHLADAMGPEAGAIASALMVGEQSRVSEAISDDMRAAGIYHILSISGLHMALAAGLIFVAVRLILTLNPHTAIHWPTKKIAAVFGLLGGFGYLLLAGSPVPAVRSYIMVACVLCAILADRKGISMFSLAWAATLILLILPESLFTASFQLSFAATLAIVALYERFGGVLFHGEANLFRKLARYCFGLMLTSLAATFYTSPLAIIHFNRMAIYGIFTNMLVVPLSSVLIMPMALTAMLTMPLGWDVPFLYVLKIGIEWMVATSHFFAALPYANILLPSPNEAGIALIIIGGLWFALWTNRARLLGLAMIIAGLATIAMFKPYDVIISSDAKRVAYRSQSGQWMMVRGDVDSFEAENWMRMQAAENILSRTEAKKSIPELSCDKDRCLISRPPETIAVALRKSAGDVCSHGVTIAISDRWLDCGPHVQVIDRTFVEKHGSTALRIAKDMLEIETTQQHRGQWPWTNQESHDDREPETP